MINKIGFLLALAASILTMAATTTEKKELRKNITKPVISTLNKLQ